jgi:HSP20 family molecular chaperone IbpA
MSDDSDFEDFDDFIRELDTLYRKLSKRLSKQIREIERMVEHETTRDEWDIKTIDKHGIKGFVAKKRSQNPPLRFPKEILENEAFFEPLVDIFEDKRSLKIYIELPNVTKEEIDLTISDGKIEVKAGVLYKIIPLPTRKIESEKAQAKYKNGVLKIRIPKLGRFARVKKGKYKIKVK